MPSGQIELLLPACGVVGDRAQAALKQFKGATVSWEQASTQLHTALSYWTSDAEDTFDNAHLLSPHSLGALVSLIYNRGSFMESFDPLDRRREMRNIRDQMRSRDFGKIPGEIRAMKRLWANNKDARGIVLRREAEAELFEAGLG
jgi:GH24 family phage-related lysozyme (muramidase)